MTTFWAVPGPDGKSLSFGSDYNKARFQAFLKKHPGVRLKIEPYTPESADQRGFFEGGVVALFTYFQDNLDYHNPDDLKKVREGLKNEFNSTFVKLGNKSIRIARSTKGELNRGFLERIMDWGAEQGYPVELLNPSEYKKWRDEVRSFGGPENYIDYLVETGKLKK